MPGVERRSYGRRRCNTVSRTTVWRKANPQKAKLAYVKAVKYQLQYRPKLRQQILDLFGNKCAVCGFSDPRALQIDHIHGGGYRQRQHINVLKIYRHILEVKGEGYQLLCANCNQIKKYVNKENRHGTGVNATTAVSEKTQQLKLLEDL